MQPINWLLESNIFPESHPPLRDAILRAGHTIIDWSDSWITDGAPTQLSAESTVFHGSLGSAAYVYNNLDWTPGSLCNTQKFYCSEWYEQYRHWLVHEKYAFATVTELIENSKDIAQSVGASNSIFVRPDSPLKPFSGRVVNVDGLSLKDLDYGFYYDDSQLPVVVAPIRNIGQEWRFVVVQNRVIAGSGYDAATRSATTLALDDSVFNFASELVSEAPQLGEAYVLDVCDCDGELRLMEFNPFSGADLYACESDAVVNAVSALAT